MAQFVVCGGAPFLKPAIVDAGSDEEARAIYGRDIGAGQDIFGDYVYKRTINLSFAENFWLHGPKEHAAFAKYGNLTVNFKTFKKRLDEFFKGRPDFESLYLEFYLGTTDATEPFPPEMMLWMYLSSWGKDLLVIPIDEVPRLF